MAQQNRLRANLFTGVTLTDSLKELNPNHLSLPSYCTLFRYFDLFDRGAMDIRPSHYSKLDELSPDVVLIKAHRQAIQREANPIPGYGNLARALRNSGRRRDAHRCVETAARHSDNTAVAQYALGELFLEDGALAAAEAAFHRAIELEPEHPFAHRQLSGILARRGHLDEAVSLAKRAFELMPDNWGFLFHHANLLARQGDVDSAETLYRRCIDHSPENAYAFTELSVILNRRGQHENAINPAAKAVDLMPDNPCFRFHLGHILTDHGDREAANAQYRAGLRLLPASNKPRAIRYLADFLLHSGAHRLIIPVLASLNGGWKKRAQKTRAQETEIA